MKRATLWKIGSIIAIVVLLNVLWFDYVSRERAIYSWDFDNYWEKCWTFLGYMHESFLLFLRKGLGSMRFSYSEYTGEPILPVTMVLSLGEKLHLFHYSRVSYVMIIGDLYFIPALIVLAWLVCSSSAGKFRFSLREIPAHAWLAVGIVALLTPAFWLPVFRGYPDGVGLIFCFLITGLFLRWRQPSETPGRRAALWLTIVVLMVGLTLFRRWYFYWVFWFWFAAGVVCLWDSFNEWRGGAKWPQIARKPVEFAMAGLAFGALLFMASPHFVLTLFRYNYADAFSAYHVTKTFGEYLLASFSDFGLLGIVLMIAGILYGLRKPEPQKMIVLQVIQLVGIVVHFGRTQDFGPHHKYLLLAVALPAMTLWVADWLPRLRWRLAIPLVAAGVASYVLSFTFLIKDTPGLVRVMIPVADGKPLDRADLGEWRRLVSSIDEHLRTDPGTVCVLSSTLLMNVTQFSSINRSLNENFITPRFVQWVGDIDKRDGFPTKLLDAKYVVLAQPVQVHLGEANQQVVVVPARQLTEGKGIGSAFEKLPDTFMLDQGVTASLYKRVRPLKKEEIEVLCDELRKNYPDRPFIYSPGTNAPDDAAPVARR